MCIGHPCCVYIMTNRSKTLYTGVSSNLHKRVWQHKTGWFAGFSSKYLLDRLVYFEEFRYIGSAIAREKEIKAMSRAKKMQLIVSVNPEWRDLSEGWYPQLTEAEMHRSHGARKTRASG